MEFVLIYIKWFAGLSSYKFNQFWSFQCYFYLCHQLVNNSINCSLEEILENWCWVYDVVLCTGLNAPQRDYSIPGSHASKIFSTISAVASLVFAYNTGMLPEIQVTNTFKKLQGHLEILTLYFVNTSPLLYLCFHCFKEDRIIFIIYIKFSASTSLNFSNLLKQC